MHEGQLASVILFEDGVPQGGVKGEVVHIHDYKEGHTHVTICITERFGRESRVPVLAGPREAHDGA